MIKQFQYQPPGFKDEKKSRHICHLIKAIYSLKLGPHAWYHRLSAVLTAKSSRPSKDDSSLFMLHKRVVRMYLHAYIRRYYNHQLLKPGRRSVINRIVQRVRSQGSWTTAFFLGIEVTKSKAGLTQNQGKYACDLLLHASMQKFKPACTPMTTSEKLSATDGNLLSNDEATMYHSIIEGLPYLTLMRPDI